MTCRSCGTTLEESRIKRQKLYCSVVCQHEHQYREYIEKWLNREVDGTRGKTLQLSRHVQRYLREKYGTSCSQCGWDENHPDDGRPLTEIDHIDGDASNSFEENLRILCPNCHSKTSTFRNRNKTSARVR